MRPGHPSQEATAPTPSFAAIFDLSPLATVTLDANGECTGANSAAANLTGIEPKHLLGAGWLRAVAAADRRKVMLGIRHASRKQVPLETVVAFVVPSRDHAWVKVSLRPLPNGAGSVVFIDDITAARDDATELSESRQMLDRIAEVSPDIIFVYDYSLQKNVYENRSVLKDLGYTDAQISSFGAEHFWAIVHEEDRAHVEAADASHATQPDGEFALCEYRVIDAAGRTRWRRDRITVFARDLSGSVVRILGISQDVTNERGRLERLRSAHAEATVLNVDLEERVAERTRELEQRNADLESFCYAVSHDLRAPLRGIDGFSKILSDDYAAELDDQARHYLKRIRCGIQRTGALMDAVLFVARLSRAKPRIVEVDLSNLANQIRADLESWGQPDLTVTVEPEMRVRMDSSMARIVLDNLIRNAIKFRAPGRPCHVHVGLRPDEDGGGIAVIDNGIGFDEQYAHKLFLPFERLHALEGYAGAGIGLHLVKRIVTMHDGNVFAKPNPTVGATFGFALP